MKAISKAQPSQLNAFLQWTYDVTAKQLRKVFSPARVSKPRYRAMKTKVSSPSLLNNKDLQSTAALNSTLLDGFTQLTDEEFELKEGLIQMPSKYMPRGHLAGSMITERGVHAEVSFDTGSDVSCIEIHHLFKNFRNPKVKVSSEGISFFGIGSGNTEVQSILYTPLVVRLASTGGEILSFEAPQVWLVEDVLSTYHRMAPELGNYVIHHDKSIDCKILLGADFLRCHGLDIVWGCDETGGADCLRYQVPDTTNAYLFRCERGKAGLRADELGAGKLVDWDWLYSL